MATVIFDLSLLALLGKGMVLDRILIELPLAYQVAVIAGAIIFPVFNICALVWAIAYKEHQRISDKGDIEDETND